jgi:hypothetical protein
VGRGFVILLDETGREVRRTLTSENGRFYFADLESGEYRLRSERIGYRAWLTNPFAVDRQDTLDFAVAVLAIPIQLSGVEVTDEAVCGSPGQDAGMGDLWEEVRKALRAASWSADHQPYRYRLHSYQRDLSARRRELLSEEIDVNWGGYRLPYVSQASDSLADHGYIVDGPDGIWYHAPDANVLLAVSFQRTHCFNVVRGEKESPGLIGLAFEPIPERDAPDIAGTLWVDEQSSALRRIEFRYTDPPFPFRDPSIGGTVEFMPLPSGAWVVARWEIRTPLAAEEQVWLSDRDTYIRTRPQRVTQLDAIRATGEAVIEIEDWHGTSVYVSPALARLHGTAFDSLRGRALAGERVSIVGTGYHTTTESDGSYELTALLAGEYSVTTARLDSLGFADGHIPVRLVPGETADLALSIPALSTIHEALCPGQGIGPVLFGVVSHPYQEGAFSNARVVASWVTSRTPARVPGNRKREVQSDGSGRYVLCDLPVNETITIEVANDVFEVQPTEVVFEADRVRVGSRGGWRSFGAPERIWRLDLRLRRRRPDH